MSVSSADHGRSTRARTLVGAGVIAAVAVLAYANSLSVPFFFDDTAAITHNASIRRLWRLGEVLHPPADGSGAMGRPLVNLSLAFNYAFGREDPRGYHLMNLTLHAFAGLALFGLVRRTLRQPVLRGRFGAAAMPVALTIAALWTAHPLQTESVSCVIQRTELLVGVFYLLTLYSFARSLGSPHSTRWRALSCVACALGMAAKEVMVSAPLLVLLYDRTFVAGSFRDAWQQRPKFHLALASTWLVLAGIVAGMGGARGAAAGFGLGISPWSYALKQCEAIVTYLQLALWPHPLVIDYGTDVVTNPLHVAPQALVLLLLAVITLAGLRARSSLGFVGAWFFAILAPSSTVVPLVTQTVAEHRMYLPLAAVITVIVAGSYAAAGSRVFAFAAGAATLAFVVATAARNHTLQDELVVWRDTVAKRPGNPRACASYALALSDRGRAAEALPYFQQSLRLDPSSAATEQNLANAYLNIGDVTNAIAHYRRALELKPDFAGAHNSLGVALVQSHEIADAIEQHREALRLDPALLGAHHNLARALFLSGRFAEAVPHFERALQEKPSADAHYNLGLALARAGELDRALPHLDDALRLKPDPAGYCNYARFLISAGRTREAIPQLEQALRLKPDFEEAKGLLERARAGSP